MKWMLRHGRMLAAIGVALGMWVAVFRHMLDRRLNSRGEWEADLLDYALLDSTNPPASDSVLFVGSSSVRHWESLHRDFPRHRVFRRGLNGSCLQDTLRYAEDLILAYDPAMIILYGGDNDLADGHTPGRVLADYQHLVDRIQRHFPSRGIGILAIKPSPSRWHLIRRIRETNRRLREWCDSADHLDFIDVHSDLLNESGKPRLVLFRPDGLHLNTNGYALWAASIRPYLPESSLMTDPAVFAGAPEPAPAEVR